MTKRIEYIDALRGLTMLLVVTGHIYSMCFMHDKFNEYNSVIIYHRLIRSTEEKLKLIKID